MALRLTGVTGFVRQSRALCQRSPKRSHSTWSRSTGRVADVPQLLWRFQQACPCGERCCCTPNSHGRTRKNPGRSFQSSFKEKSTDYCKLRVMSNGSGALSTVGADYNAESDPSAASQDEYIACAQLQQQDNLTYLRMTAICVMMRFLPSFSAIIYLLDYDALHERMKKKWQQPKLARGHLPKLKVVFEGILSEHKTNLRAYDWALMLLAAVKLFGWLLDLSLVMANQL